MTAVSASTRSAQSKLSAPLSTHLNTGTTVVSASPATKSRKIGQLRNIDRKSAPVVSDFATTLPSIRLPKPATTAASKGPNTMIRIWTGDKDLPLHPVDVVDRDGAAAAEVDNQDREPDRCFARGHRQHEHR